MGVFHRLAATVMMGLFAYHLLDVAKRKRGSGASWIRFIFGKDSLMFNGKDLKDVIGSFKWFFGLGPRPEYGRFTYWEKFDYFAVFWGMIVIGGSGLFLWFPEFFTRILPGWAINVATIIHSDEALLATAFIFTVHFFNTHFRPDKFPMDPVIFTGRVPVEELKYDKPFEYRELVESGQLEARLVDPMPKQTERWFRLFGYSALTIGLTLVAAIIYPMLFGYR
jgi:cytochrome b subunit of formate dehydrogenase